MRRLLSLCCLIALAGCDARPMITLPGEEINPCATALQRHDVRIVDADGQPVLDLQTQSVVLTTGQLLKAANGSGDGLYLVADDSDRAAFADGSRIVRFTATGERRSAQADFVFAYDGCHVTKESGPAQISAT